MRGSYSIILVVILSLLFGTNYAFAESHNISPISASTELSIYGNGDNVIITGNIKNYDSSSGDSLTYFIKSPINELVTIGQLTPSSNGSFKISFIAGGPLWTSSGDYIVEFHFGAITGETTIVYIGGEPPKPEPAAISLKRIELIPVLYFKYLIVEDAISLPSSIKIFPKNLGAKCFCKSGENT